MPRKKTTEEFKQEVFDKVGNEYSVLENYSGANTKIRMKHNTCGKEYYCAPNSFLGGSRCPYCSINHKKTTEEFKQEVFDRVGNEYSVLENYSGVNTKIRMKHNVCGKKYNIAPNKFLQGHRCPYCATNHKKTTDEYKQEVFDRFGNEYSILGKYTNNKTKIKLRHNICGNVYDILPSVLLSGCGCSYCSGNHKKTTEEFKQEVFDRVGDEYTVLGDYVNAKTQIKMRHNTCGNEYEVIPSSLLNGYGCSYCSGKHKKTTEEFKQEVFELSGNEYSVLGAYVNSNTKIKIRHNTCGNEYEVIPNNFLRGIRCTNGSNIQNSRGIQLIVKLLDKNNISYLREKPINAQGHRLRFDIYISKLNIVIEFDGEQHFKSVEYFGGDEGFKKRQYLDNLKNKYCNEHDIKLLRIPYTQEKEIPEILTTIIAEYKSN